MNWKDAAKYLRGAQGVVGGAQAMATAFNPWLGVAVGAASAGLGLAASLAEKGLDPITHITRIESSLADFDAAVERIEDYARGKIRSVDTER